VGPVTFVALVLAAVIVQAARRRPSPPPKGARAARLYRDPPPLFVLTWLFVLPPWLLAFAGLWRGDVDVARVAVLVGGLVVALPWPWARLFAIPLGWPRAAAALAHLAAHTWRADRDGGAALAAVLAARNSGDAHDVARARARVEQLDRLGGAGVVAAALLADHDGDVGLSARTLEAVACFDRRVVPPAARRVAVELRAQHLLARGDWSALRKLAPEGSRFAVFAARCAARLDPAGRAAPTDEWTLRLRWLLTPRRRRTRALLTRALARPAAPASAAPPTPAEPLSAPTLQRAVALQVWSTKAARVLTPDHLTELGHAWAEALDSLEQQRRTAGLGVGVPVGAGPIAGGADGFADGVVVALAELAALLDLSRFSLVDQPAVLVRAIERERTARLDALEIAVAALALRLEQADSGDLPPSLELREWLGLRALYDGVARMGADGRALAWQTAKSTICEAAVRLWNVRGEHRLAHAMNRWLLSESLAVGDERSRETHEFNVRCGS